MNIKALLTTLILGSSSVAMAKPVVSGSVSVSLGYDTLHTPAVVQRHTTTRHDAPLYTPPVRPTHSEPFFSPTNSRVGARSSTYIGMIGQAPRKRFSRNNYWHRAAAPVWFNLTEATRIDSGRQFFNILGQSGKLSQIRLQNLGGRSEIKQVAIEFDNGDRNQRTQVVRFDTMLDRNNPMLTIDLDGGFRNVKRIIVYGSSGRGAAYKIQAL